MWNCQVNGLLNGTTICIFDGSPGGSKDKPDWETLWRFVSRSKATFFGAGAAFFASCAKAEIDLAAVGDLSALRALGSTGSPLSADTQQWFNDRFARLAEVDGNVAHAGHLVGEHVWGYRLRRRVHRSQPRTPANAGTDAVPASGRGRGSLR